MLLAENNLVQFEEYEIDRAQWSLRWRAEPIALNRKTFDLLICLVDNRERVLSKDELLQTLWPGQFVEESNLTQHVFLLRKALSRHESGSKIVQTVPGRGYRFAASLTETAPAPEVLRIATTESITKIVIEEEETAEAGPHPSHLRFPAYVRTLLLAAVVAVLLAVSAWFGWQHWLDRGGGAPVQVVLVPLTGTTGDATLDQSLTQVLRMDLVQSPYVSVVPDSTVQSTLRQMMQKPGDPMTAATAREVCERTNSQTVLSGSVVKAGQHFLLMEEATSCVNGAVQGSAKYEASGMEDLPHGIDQLALKLRRSLGESRRSIARFATPLFHDNTPSLDALKAFTLGTQAIRDGRMPEAITLLKTALVADPHLASAEYNLAAAYGAAGDDLHAREEIEKAYKLRDGAMKPAQLAIEAMYDSETTGDLYKLLRTYESWKEQYPESSQAWSGLAGANRDLTMNQAALVCSRRVVELLPHSQGMQANLALDQMLVGDLQGARRTCEQAIANNMDGDGIRVRYLQVAYALHDEALLSEQRAWRREHPQAVLMLSEETAAAMAEGRFRDARELMLKIREVHRQQGISSPDDQTTKFAAVALMESGDLEAGKKIFEEFPVDPEEGQQIVGLVYTGDLAGARAAIQAMQARHPEATMIQHFWAPRIEAEIALAEHRPADAVAVLEQGRPLDRAGLHLPWLRGRAYLAAGRPADAEREFRVVIDHANLDPTEPAISLAWLGLGEALAAEGNHAAAAEAYRQFLRLWAHADPDAFYLKKAKQELSALSGS